MSKEYFVEPCFLFNEETQELKLAFPEELIQPSLKFDPDYGNQKVTGKYRYSCLDCGFDWLNGYKSVCPVCGARDIIDFKFVKGEKVYFFKEKNIGEPAGDRDEYGPVRKYLREKGLR